MNASRPHAESLGSKPIPVGAHWIRAALQVNPYEYVGANAPRSKFASEDEYNDALLDRCQTLGIGLIAITDHWRVDSAAGLISAAHARGIVALPGFEANSSEGVHVLVIFEVGTNPAKVNAAIGLCGVEPGCPNGTTGAPFKEILARMTERGALVIPAHANAPRGMLTGRSGQPLIAMVNDPNLDAIAVSPGKPDGTDQQAIIDARRPYDRTHKLAVVHADDVCHPDALEAPGATTWFKVSATCVKSLRMAVRTPATRVSLTDPVLSPHAVLLRISWIGGFLDGVTIPVAADLTTLIGGRGTGKSTVIESLRYVLDVEPIGVGAGADHRAIVESVLGAGAVVRLEVEQVRPIPRRFAIERAVPNPPVVYDSSGTATNMSPADVVGHVEIFGQHELAELAGDKARVAEMLRRLSGSSGPSDEHLAVIGSLEENRTQLANVEKRRAKLVDELADIPRLEDQVRQYDESNIAIRLTEVRRLDGEGAVFTEALDRVRTLHGAVREFAHEQLAAQLTAGYDDIADSPQQAILQQAATATTLLASRLTELVGHIKAAIGEAENSVTQAKGEWDTAVGAQKDGHAEVLRTLVEAGLHPEQYLTTAKALDKVKAKEQRLPGIEKSLADLGATRVKLLGELSTHERTSTEELAKAIRAANNATGGVVNVRPVPSPDRSHIKVVLGKIRGQRAQIMAAVDRADFSPRSLVQMVRDGEEALDKSYSIRGAQAAALLKAGEPLLRELEELTVGQAVEVHLDVAASTSPREYRSMDELSKGQRATALLLLLLGASTAPLVIDQPEDDLDNRFVYDGVVTKLRDLKGSRQIVASTHNANVPVLGDAELIVVLESDGRKGQPVEGGVGSLDDATIRGFVESILEGGTAAFNARQHLYGF